MNAKFYKVSAAPLFEADLTEIVSYTTNRLGDIPGAIRLVDAVTEAVFERLGYPERYEPYPSARPHPYPYYFLHVGGYTVYYVVIGNTMELRRLLYNGRPSGDPTAGRELPPEHN